jgi:transposase
MQKEIITMSTKESVKIHIIQKLNEKLISQVEAAQTIDYSTRHIRRILRSYQKYGIKALIHRSRGKPSPKKLSLQKITQIVNLYKSKYVKFTPTHFTEMLNESEGISISKEKVRQILIDYEFWVNKPRRFKHRKQRPRMSHSGMLVQIDGSHDPWFEDRGPRCVLMSMIDDATSLIYSKFYHYEGTMPALDCLIGYIQKYGIPMALYSDRHPTYHGNANKKQSIEDQLNNQYPLSRFQQSAQELGIKIIPAYSPQAKGRVERSFGIFQNRLKSELRLHKIGSIEQANAFLPNFLNRYNNRFAKKQLAQGDIHKDPLPTAILRKILASKENRHLANDFTIRYNNHIFQITEPTIHKHLTVIETTTGQIYIKDLKDNELKFKLIKKPQTQEALFKTKWILPRINTLTLKEICV